jgi:hypothetical protein
MIVRLHGRQIERQIIQYTCLDAVTHMQKMNHLLGVSLIGPLCMVGVALDLCPC